MSAAVVLKERRDQLALHGGPPAFAEPVHVGRPNVGDVSTVLRRIADALERRWLSNDGPLVQAFEQRLSELTGGLHCVATCNGTLALQIALRALGVTGEVVMPSLTFVATAHAAAWEGLEPVFADADPVSLCLDPDAAAAATGPRTGALVGVHVWGRPCDVAGLERVAAQREVPLVFDAAHALGVVHDGRPLCAYGDASILSFHATKVANAFEGGAIVTADPELARRAARMRNFGFADEDAVAGLGTNAKLSEAGAAMGLSSLEALDGFLAANRTNYAAYREGLAGVPGVELVDPGDLETSNCHHVVVLVDAARAGLDRDGLREVLRAENVLARRYFHPGCHQAEPYRRRPEPPSLPVTEDVLSRSLALPTGTAVEPEHVRAICRVIELAASPVGAAR